jgi:hypothetical protein
VHHQSRHPESPAYVDFFARHFDWVVLENELKWYHTEAAQGQVSCADADALIHFCDRHNEPVRGHCIFRGLVTRYAGRFPHYEVNNNEMLHGSFFRGRLGDDIDARLFRGTARIDPGPRAVRQRLQRGERQRPQRDAGEVRGAGHRPAEARRARERDRGPGPRHAPGGRRHLRLARQALAVTGLPVWITELDVSAADENVRADDLEVVLREAYAHPAVEGVTHVALPRPARRQRRRPVHRGREQVRGAPPGVDLSRHSPQGRWTSSSGGSTARTR